MTTINNAVPGRYSTLATKLFSIASVTGTLGRNLTPSALAQDSLALVKEVQTLQRSSQMLNESIHL